MEPRIETLKEIKLIGREVRMSFNNNITKELWQSFMPNRAKINNNIGSELYSVEIYNGTEFFKNFNLENEFDKWAAVRVTDYYSIPDDMESLDIPQGLYAVFLYKGKASRCNTELRIETLKEIKLSGCKII